MEGTNDVHTPVSEEYCLMQSFIGGILANKSFTLPTEGNKMCLNMVEKLAQCYSTNQGTNIDGVGLSKMVIEFASWFAVKLNGIIVEAQRRRYPNELNKEHLRKTF